MEQEGLMVANWLAATITSTVSMESDFLRFHRRTTKLGKEEFNHGGC
jgi:hypothetical protein